jgi:hypothetical protein
MKVLWSGIGMVAGAGKLNGTVLSKNRGGAYARVKVTPTNPQTIAQQNSRNILSTWSQGWRGLTPEQRQGWINAAPSFPYTDVFGASRILSGQQLYVKLNANLNYAGVTGIPDAPSPVEIPAITAFSIATASSTVLTVAFSPTPVPADFSLIIRATPSIPPGIAFVKNRFRIVAALPETTATAHSIFAAYSAIFGDPTPANYIFAQAFYISTVTGQPGIPLQASLIIS